MLSGCLLTRTTGWYAGFSWHGDDGKLYTTGFDLVNSKELGEFPWKTGDVIGCGWDMAKGVVFWTKNGKNLGAAVKYEAGSAQLHPCVGMESAGQKVSLVFYAIIITQVTINRFV